MGQNHPRKGFIVIIGVIEFPLFTGNNSARPSRAGARCDHGILSIVASWLVGQEPFAILKGDTVTVKGKRPALDDQDDVQNVFSNVEISEDEMAKLS